MSDPRDRVLDCFIGRYNSSPFGLARAPGRVNLIGEHTDYNDGFVMPMAIDREIWIAFKPRSDKKVRLYSLDLDIEIFFSLDQLQPGGSGPEIYLQGVAWALYQAGYSLAGFDGVVHGNIPIGAGLSSSAALEVSATRVFSAISGFFWGAKEMAQVAQRAENDWVGVECGIMDQFASALGHTHLIDCRTLETLAVPLPANCAVVIMDTGTRRGLVDSAYNERRRQCQQAAESFGVPALRDVTPQMLTRGLSGLDPTISKRARHIVSENLRVLSSRRVMRDNDPKGFGEIMNQSHTSLRVDFEVSSPALDKIVEFAQQHPACYGARMTGAGFGGCAVALVNEEGADDFIQSVSPRYQDTTGNQPSLYVCHPVPGASLEHFD